MSQPARDSGNGKQDWEHVCREPHCLVDETRIEVHVGVQLPRHKVVVTEGSPLELHCLFNERLATSDGKDFLGDPLHDPGPRVVGAVHSVTEPHESLLLVLDSLDKLVNVAHLLEHSNDRLVSSTVLRTVQSPRCCGNRSVYVDSTRCEVPHGRRGAIQLVLSVQQEQSVQRLDQLGMRPECNPFMEHVHHVEEVLDVSQVGVRDVKWATHAVAVHHRSNGRGVTHDATDLLVADMRVGIDVLGSQAWVLLGMESTHSRKSGNEHAHRVRVVTESLYDSRHVRVYHRMGHQIRLPFN